MSANEDGQEPGGIPAFPVSVSDRQIHLIIGLLMGLGAYGLAERADWLAERAWIAYPLWLCVIFPPTLFMLCYARASWLRALGRVGAGSALLALLAIYTGWQASPLDKSPFDSFWVFALSMQVACFVALIHLQPEIWGRNRDYETFFTLSWRNFLTVMLSAALALCVRGTLYLWESLFELIDIEFFSDLFEKDWFMYPVLAMSFALGLNSFGTASSIIDRVSTLLARLIWVLLPVLALANTSFLATLPFAGLQPLWDSNLGTAILMSANFWGLFFLNAVYQTGERLPYPRLTHRALSVAVVLLPVLSGLAAYGLLTRVAQYGWTPDRCWAMLIIVLMATYSLGYACIIAWRRDDWPSSLPTINRHLSWVVLASLLLTASPLLDFRSISAWSQISRVEFGKVLAEDLDVRHMSREMGRPGRMKLEALLESLDQTDPEAALVLRDKVEGTYPGGWTAPQQARIVMRPAPFDIPADLAKVIDSHNRRVPDLLFRVDLGGTDTPEVVAVWVESTDFSSFCVTRRNGEWASCGSTYEDTDLSRAELLQELSTGEMGAVVPDRSYKDLRIGDVLIERTSFRY